MSASGHSRRFDPLPVTSGLPRTTDINRPASLVRFVPTGDTRPSNVRAQLSAPAEIAWHRTGVRFNFVKLIKVAVFWRSC